MTFSEFHIQAGIHVTRTASTASSTTSNLTKHPSTPTAKKHLEEEEEEIVYILLFGMYTAVCTGTVQIETSIAPQLRTKFSLTTTNWLSGR